MTLSGSSQSLNDISLLTPRVFKAIGLICRLGRRALIALYGKVAIQCSRLIIGGQLSRHVRLTRLQAR
jgi:hypothetical protein